jgi:hypothetical protein
MTDHTTQQMGQNPIKYPVKSQFFDVEPRKRQQSILTIESLLLRHRDILDLSQIARV